MQRAVHNKENRKEGEGTVLAMKAVETRKANAVSYSEKNRHLSSLEPLEVCWRTELAGQ